jgi:hypothetical protein
MEKKTYTGLWWEPLEGSPEEENRLPGTLTIESGANLRLVGQEFQPGARRQPVPIMHGATDEEGLITLVDLRPAGGGIRMPGLSYTQAMPTLVLLGDLYPSVDSIQFDSVIVTFDYLDEWLGAWHFDGNIMTTGVTHSPKAQLSIMLSTLGAKIDFDHSLQVSQKNNAYTAEHTSYLKISTHEQKPFEWFENIVHELERFLSLCVAVPISARTMLTRREHREVSLIHGRRPVRPVHQKPTISPPIILPMIQGNIEKILNEWFDKSPLLKRVFGIFQDSVADQTQDLSARFLNTVQLLEIYHRAKHGQSIALVQRLRGLVNDLTGLEQGLLCNDNQQFMQIAANTRNFLQHFNSDAIIFDNLDLYWATEILRTLTMIWLYREIGLAPNDVVRWISNHHDFLTAFDLNRLELFRSGRASLAETP